jgi:hypothetical protein
MYESKWINRYADWIRAGPTAVRGRNSFFINTSLPTLGPIWWYVQRICEFLSSNVKRSGKKYWLCTSYIAKVKTEWNYSPSWCGTYLIRPRILAKFLKPCHYIYIYTVYTAYATWFSILKLCILPTACICVFSQWTVAVPLSSINRLVFVAET